MEANADAIGGSLAASISVLAFYPLEIIRVHLQTQSSENRSGVDIGGHLSRVIRGLCDKGMALRLSHTLITSFVYYRLHKLVSERQGKKRTLYSNLFASNCASMLTVLLAMPLEGLVLRAQKATNDASGSDEEAQEEGNDEYEDERPTTRGDVEPRTAWEELLSAYQGLSPALLLCLNPMIHYTVFDWLKQEALNRERSLRDIVGGALVTQNTASSLPDRLINRKKLTYSDLDSHQLGTGQAFMIGIAAKVVATLATFPLLRAKMLMMTETDIPVGESAVSDTQEGESAVENRDTQVRTRGRSNDLGRLMQTLWMLLKMQGISGLYTGIFIHLIHTTLRSAVSMSLKERLVQAIQRLYVVRRDVE